MIDNCDRCLIIAGEGTLYNEIEEKNYIFLKGENDESKDEEY